MVWLTAPLTWRQATEPGKPVAVSQIAIATIAFVVWVFALGVAVRDAGFLAGPVRLDTHDPVHTVRRFGEPDSRQLIHAETTFPRGSVSEP